MTQSGENKELKAAFDEFKELMEKRVEPIFEMPPFAPTENDAQIEPKAHFDTELKVGAPTFTIPRRLRPLPDRRFRPQSCRQVHSPRHVQ